MNFSAIFIRRPVATTLLTIGMALAGIVAFNVLPVSPLPEIDFPTISVSASLPGADPETVATSITAPLERQLGHIAGVTELTSTSSLSTSSIVIQFDLDRNIDGAARDVQAAINAARTYLPTNLPSNPTYRKVNPADAPILSPGAYFPHSEQGEDVRCGLDDTFPEALTSTGDRPGLRGRRLSARGPYGIGARTDEQLRDRPG